MHCVRRQGSINATGMCTHPSADHVRLLCAHKFVQEYVDGTPEIKFIETAIVQSDALLKAGQRVKQMLS